MPARAKIVSLLVFPLCLVALVCLSVQAQTTARIVGTVRDAQRAVIVDAGVSSENFATGEKRVATTDASGAFALTSLSPGDYQISISAHGFTSAMFRNVRAGIGDTLTINAVLKIARATSEITVNDDPPLLQLGSAEIGLAIDARTLSAMPLPTRNFLQLAALSPGISMPLTNNSAIGRNTPNFSVNGARTSQNYLQINGVDANDISAHDFNAVAIPAPESIGELVVQTSMYDASMEGAGGGVQVVTKSGGNALHGSVYEYFRNTALNANDPNLKAVGLGPPVLRRNVYGATVGGPIRKDRAFFFLSYQGARETNGATDQSLYKSVLIADGLTDDRSETVLLNTFKVPVIDPTALALLNARLPSGQFLIPTPQQDGRVTGTAVSTYHEEQFNTNFDYRFGSADSLAAKFFFANAPQFYALGGATFSTGSGLPGFGTETHCQQPDSLAAGSPYFQPDHRQRGSLRLQLHPQQRSATGTNPGLRRRNPSPHGRRLSWAAADFAGPRLGRSDYRLFAPHRPRHFAVLSLVDILSLQRGRHSIRVGGEFHRYQWDAHANGSLRGN